MAQDPQLNEFAQQFLKTYYTILDGPADSRAGIAQLYNDACQMTYEGQKFDGKNAVAAKFASLSSIASMVHDITSFDVQMVNEATIMIAVLGQFKTNDQEHALGFMQTFLVKGEGGSFTIIDDIYRLALFNNVG
ncbi:nuclear transport factor 2-like [Argopecten irradians]|uniref:nuclear transport factor 2-like n=1 Tax=Argopecten irradians TaxID=31199 RepID=UPI00371559E0